MSRLPLSCLLLTLLASASVHADDWRQGWGLVPPPGQATPAGGSAGAATMAQLRLQPVGGQWQARIDNALAGPLQIELRAAPGHPVDGLPVQSLIQGDSSLVVGHLPAPIDGRTLDLRLQSVPGNPAAQAEDVAYRLPFDAAPPCAWTRRRRDGSAMATRRTTMRSTSHCRRAPWCWPRARAR